MIELLGLFLLVLGVLALIRGFRGRLLNTHPHCRGCGFDLHGLSFDTTSRCPECGRIVSSSKVAVSYAKRRRRPGLVVLGVFVVLLGIAGVGWQPISRSSGLQNIDWYDYLPESTLISLEAKGNTKALAELHSRLIPGELSDEGLQKLIDRSMAMLDDESVPWDERWGDVLLYALLTERMSDQDAKGYFERAFALEVDMDDQIGPDTTTLGFRIRQQVPNRGSSSPAFRNELGTVVGVSGHFSQPASPYQYRAESRIPRFAASGRARPDRFGAWLNWAGGEAGSRGGWFPFSGGAAGSGSDLRLEPGSETYELPFAARFEVMKDGNLFHQWEIEISKEIRRVEEPDYYDQLNDTAQLARIAEALRITGMRVPDDPHAAAGVANIADSSESLFGLVCGIDSPLGLLGDLWVDVGDEQIRLIEISKGSLRRSIQTFHTGNIADRDERRGVKHFIEHEAFWEKAKARGSVDIIYDPVPEREVSGGSRDNTIARAFIWRDVPVAVTTLQPMRVQQLDGSIVTMTELSEAPGTRPLVSGMSHPDAVPGKLLDPAGADE